MRAIVDQLRLVCVALLVSAVARADHFTYVDRDGDPVEVEARLAGSGQGLHALELADGQIRLVPQQAVLKRDVAPGPEPLDADAMIERLAERFGADRFRASAQRPFVCGLVLSSPLDGDDQERRARSLLNTATRFMKRVEVYFKKFARAVRVQVEPPRFPLVVLIFETDNEFEEYLQSVSNGRGPSAGNISGFYSGLTNYLAIRMSECHSFEVPLHEAIHQQVYNRQLFRRLAPIPVWFDEGIATGFEGNGERIRSGPLQINSHYVRKASRGTRFPWSEVVANDRTFHGDVLAGDAYTHAWCLHWLLVAEYRGQYSQYIKRLAQKEPLAVESAEDRVREFEQVFGKSVDELQQQLGPALTRSMKRRKVEFGKPPPPGLSVTESNLGQVALTAVRNPGTPLIVEGKLTNLSPLRAMTYHVTVETTAGTYAEWYVPGLGIKKTAVLQRQAAQKLMRNARGSASNGFYVRIRSVSPDSETARRWSRGDFPVPVFRQ